MLRQVGTYGEERTFRQQNPSDVFREEYVLLDAKRDEWLAEHHGEFVVIKGSELLGFFTTFMDAFRAGLALIGYQEMLITPVLKDEESWLGFLPDELEQPWEHLTVTSPGQRT
jgi:hypothetical protein